MKKIRIELKPDSKVKPFLIFESSEALYLWMTDVGAPLEPPGSQMLTITPGEFIEAEWQGCEYVYEDDGSHKRLDFIRLAKGMPTKNASGILVSIHAGWVTADQVCFKDCEDEVSTTRLLPEVEDWLLDLSMLFKDDDDEDSKAVGDEPSGDEG